MHYRQITYEVTLISSDHYKNSSVIVHLAMGQIPRSTERISSLNGDEHSPTPRCTWRFCDSGPSTINDCLDVISYAVPVVHLF